VVFFFFGGERGWVFWERGGVFSLGGEVRGGVGSFRVALLFMHTRGKKNIDRERKNGSERCFYHERERGTESIHPRTEERQTHRLPKRRALLPLQPREKGGKKRAFEKKNDATCRRFILNAKRKKRKRPRLARGGFGDQVIRNPLPEFLREKKKEGGEKRFSISFAKEEEGKDSGGRKFYDLFLWVEKGGGREGIKEAPPSHFFLLSEKRREGRGWTATFQLFLRIGKK